MSLSALPYLNTFSSTNYLSFFAKERLAEFSFIRTLKKNEVLWETGDPGEFCALINSGYIEILRPVGSNKETCMGIFGPGDIIGLSAVTKKTKYPGRAQAIHSNTSVAKIYLRSVLKGNESSTHELHSWAREMTIAHEQILRDKIDFLAAGSVNAKLFECLLHLERRFGKALQKDLIEIPFSLTRLQIAKLIDTTVETLIRTVGKWEKNSLISWRSKKIHFRPIALQNHLQQINKNGR